MKLFLGIILSTIFLSFTSCDRKSENSIRQNKHFEFSTNVEELVNKESEDTTIVRWFNKHTFYNDSSNNYCSKINNTNAFGIGAEIKIPKELWNLNFVLSVKSRLKNEGNTPDFSLIVQMEINDSLIFWEAKNLNEKIHKKGKWEIFLEEIKFPRNFSTKDARLTLYFMNQDTVNAYVDDLIINLTNLPSPAFTPKVDKSKFGCTHELNKTFKNKYYSIDICKNGNLQVSDSKGNFIFDDLTHIIEVLQPNDTEPLIYSTSSFTIKTIRDKSVVLTASNPICKIEIEINTVSTTGEIKYTTKTTFLDSSQLHREALIFSYVGELKEVYKKNRKVDLENFEDEYWLEKQGCKIGAKENTCYIYNQQNISSLQLDTKHNYLIVNLDYSKDHPLLHFPLMHKANNIYEDISCNIYCKNETKKNEFSFSIGIDNDYFPRVLRNPDGFLATYVFTEHADYTDIKTHRATYFGSSKTTNSNDATGGFIKHKIPVTKSIFYSNYDKEMNDDKRNNTSFNSPITSIKNTPFFLNFLLDIKKHDIDLCLHTPEQNTTTKDNLITAAQFVKENFNSSCWIDHGYDNGISNNREDIVCDGLIKNSEFYSLDILKQNNIKYFWNCYYEDVNPFNGFNFNSFIGSPYIGYGNSFPTPYYWQHQSKAPGVYFWPTSSVSQPGNDWEYFFNEQRINDFIRNYSVEFNHCYPAWINSEKGFWIYSEEGELVINPYFNKTLKMLSDYRDKGLINLTTIKKILDYWITLEDVTIQNVGKNKFIVTNNTDTYVNGFSIAVQAEMIYVNNEIPKHKYYLKDFICWFDLKPKEKKTLTLNLY